MLGNGNEKWGNNVEAPAWNDPENNAGSMIRGAQWLLQVVGEGNTFTKNELRRDFPEVSQIDRRIRDLRDYGWIVYSSTEDASLLLEDQRFVKAGAAVWDPEERRKAAPHKTISAKERQAVLVRDGYMCTLCGIAATEQYPDDIITTAVLAVSRRLLLTADNDDEEVFMTECKRCKSGLGAAPIDARDVLSATRDLNPRERRRLLRWMERGRRGTTELDRAWAAYRRIPSDRQKDFIDQIRLEE